MIRRRPPVRVLVLLPAVQLLLSAAALRAAFDEQDRQLPWAQDAASASAFNAVRFGLQGTVYNPAALGFGEDLQAGASGGNGGKEADAVFSGAVLGPLQDDLSAGLAYRQHYGSAGPGFSEQSVGLSAALEPWAGVSLGLRPWLHQASTRVGLRGSGMGFSLDLGMTWDLRLGPNFHSTLGWWGSQMVSEWPDRFWRRAVPAAQHGGWSLRWARWGELAVGLEQSTQGGQDLPLVQRAGLRMTRYNALRPSLGISSDPMAQLSAGVEAPFKLGRARFEAAYAVLLPAAGGDLRHRLQLNSAFPVRRRQPLVAVPLKVVYEPGTRKVKSATVSLNLAAASKAEAWELEIRDKTGKVVRVLTGEGTPPALVTWDGKDALGEALEDGQSVSYKLNIKTASGLRSSEPSFALGVGMEAGGLEALATADAASLVVPVTDDSGQVTQLSLRPPGNTPGEAQRWQIVVQNESGETLRTLEGEGPVPQQLLWDGQTQDGTSALNESGLRVRFNTWDAEGRISSADQSLGEGLQPVAEEVDEPLPQLGLKLPAFREGGPPMTLMLSSSSLVALSEVEPTPAPTRVPTAQPTRSPTLSPTPWPSSTPTPGPSPVPTAVPPTAIPTPAPPTVVPTPLANVAQESGGIGSGLSRPNYLASPDLLPPVFMTREQAEGTRPRRSGGRSSRSRLPAAIDGVLDVFVDSSDEIDPAKVDRLQAFFWRLGAFRQRRILLTGLLGPGESGSEELSRQRVRVISRMMVEEGGFQGEFILKVDGRNQAQRGVRIEVLRR